MINLREGVHHGCDRWLISGADIVKVQHALHCPCLHTPHYGLGVLAEEGGCLGYRVRKAKKQMEIKERSLKSDALCEITFSLSCCACKY